MRFNEFTPESVAGPKNCWPGHRKTGTQAGTGKNAGKRVNDCEKIKEEGAGLNEFAPGSGGGESGRWYTDDQITDLVGEGWYNDLDVSGDIPKQEMIEQAQAWLDDQGYSVQVLNCRVNDDDMEWFIEGNFHNPRFAKKGVAEGAENLNYIGNCTDDDVIEHIFGDATGFAQAVDEYGDEFTLDDLVVKYDPETDVHSFYYKEQGVAEGLEQQYLWHGSRQKIPMLEPRQSVDTGGAVGSNQNAIYATSDPKVAIAMGLTTPGSDTGMFPNDPQMVLFSGKIRKGENVYLHKVPMNGPDGKPQFVQGGNSREFHSVSGVEVIKPTEIKAVPVDKYLNLIRQATQQDLELRKKYMKQGVAEAKGLAKKVKVVKGEHAGKTGWIREIKHGAFNGAPKAYYIDLDDGGQANNLPATALRLVKAVDEASLATMRDYFAGDKNADDPSASSQQRKYFSKNDGSKSPVEKKFRSPAEYEQWLAQKKDKQAFKVSEGVIIGASETGDPMDPQVAVLGGAGSYSLKGLYNKAQRESSQLTKDIGLGNFRSSSLNVKQLANTLNTIVAAHNELEAIRKGGGAKSRGIERGVDYKE